MTAPVWIKIVLKANTLQESDLRLSATHSFLKYKASTACSYSTVLTVQFENKI